MLCVYLCLLFIAYSSYVSLPYGTVLFHLDIYVVRTHTQARAQTCTRTHARTYTRTHARTHTYTQSRTLVRALTHIHTHTRTHACTHTHTHTHTLVISTSVQLRLVSIRSTPPSMCSTHPSSPALHLKRFQCQSD